MKFSHTNIVTADWKRLSQFYSDVFDCKPIPPERNQSGDWLEKGTGVRGATLQGVHLRLPGHGNDGPTLEIYQYTEVLSRPGEIAANRLGLGHLAFEVNDVDATRHRILDAGGTQIGETSTAHVPGKGQLTFIYMADPDGNLLEIQSWDAAADS